MFCTKCGTQMSASAHFCPGCGVAVSAETAAAVRPTRSRRSLWLLSAAALALIAAVAVTVILRRPPSPAPGAALAPAASGQETAPSTAAATIPAAPTPTTPAFDWTGLSHEDLLKARNALDTAIAREEHSSSDGTAAQASAQ